MLPNKNNEPTIQSTRYFKYVVLSATTPSGKIRSFLQEGEF